MLKNIIKPRPGDIVLFDPKTFFGKAVERIQNIFKTQDIQESKTHAALVADSGDAQPKPGETNLRVTDIEFGRRASSYFVQQRHAHFKIYRLYNSEQSYYSETGARKAKSEDISRRAAEIAVEMQGAQYSLFKCYRALQIHRSQNEHSIPPEYYNELNTFDKHSTFMCVSFVLICYQKACMELLGGLPLAFKINAFCAPSYLAHHFAKPDGHFTQIPEDVIRDIFDSGAPVYHAASLERRSSWTWSFSRRGEYEPLLAGEEPEEEDNAAGLGFSYQNQ